MRTSFFFTILIFGLFVTSCTNDYGSGTLTYSKATAVYDDLDGIRNQPLIEDVRELVDPGKVYISSDLLLIGEEDEGIHIYDNTDPENPQQVSFINIPMNKEFYVENNMIYAESMYDMLKIDISDKNSPVLVNRVKNAFAQEFSNDKGETLVGFEYKTVTEEVDEGSDIWNEINNQNQAHFDFQNRLIPSSAVPTSFAGSSGSSIGTVNRIAVMDDYVYVISSEYMTVLRDDIELEFVTNNHVGWMMETIYPSGNELYIGSRNSMEIFSVSIPEFPQRLGGFFHATSCDPVLPLEDVAYVTLRTSDDDDCPGDTNALVVLNTRNRNFPTQIQEIEMDSPYGMTMIGSTLYVGEGENGLKTFDATNTSNLILDKHDTEVKAYDIISHPTRSDIILIATPDGFGQYRVADRDLTLLSWIQS